MGFSANSVKFYSGKAKCKLIGTIVRVNSRTVWIRCSFVRGESFTIKKKWKQLGIDFLQQSMIKHAWGVDQ
jgi:hypothetical protein